MADDRPEAPARADDARAQLTRFLAAADVLDLPSNPPGVTDPRAAAVLILFGVLDDVPSARASPARAAAGGVSRDLDVLLLERASTLRAHAGQIAFPGGRIDPCDESATAAALREAREETGLDPAGVEVLGALAPVPLARSRHLVVPVVGWWRHPSPVGVVDTAESSAVFRVPVADLVDPAHRVTTRLERGGTTWSGPAFLVYPEGKERLVWGFTALLLDALLRGLGWAEDWDASRVFPLDGWV